ncbi:hypothetical protein EDB89DRAFT_1910890 [Lactarius sanguifluus]|nr:hypothetical protein EDB89DRAFT_1910890 [Lactarius sanguifluus]
MDPTWHLNNSQQPIPANYPLPPPHAVAPHPGYLPHGVPYPPLTPGPTPPGPYLPTAHGYYGQQYQSFYAPYYAHPAPMPSPLHLASGVAGSVPVPMPMPTRQLPATPMCHPPATPARTPCGTGKRYVNSQCEPGVWEFDVSVASSEAKSIFKGHSAMSWDELQTEVLKRLRDTALPVQLGYKLSRDVGKVSYLSSEEEWEATLTHLDTKITMAWKNTTKPLSKVSKVLGSREKRRRQDDIPPPMTRDVNELSSNECTRECDSFVTSTRAREYSFPRVHASTSFHFGTREYSRYSRGHVIIFRVGKDILYYTQKSLLSAHASVSRLASFHHTVIDSASWLSLVVGHRSAFLEFMQLEAASANLRRVVVVVVCRWLCTWLGLSEIPQPIETGNHRAGVEKVTSHSFPRSTSKTTTTTNPANAYPVPNTTTMACHSHPNDDYNTAGRGSNNDEDDTPAAATTTTTTHRRQFNHNGNDSKAGSCDRHQRRATTRRQGNLKRRRRRDRQQQRRSDNTTGGGSDPDAMAGVLVRLKRIRVLALASTRGSDGYSRREYECRFGKLGEYSRLRVLTAASTSRWAVHQAFKELDIKLKCEAHKGHCFVDHSGGCDNHKRLDHRDLTVWAQQIASLDATIHAPPNLKLFDRPATKKPRHSHGTPEVHVAVNIAAPVSTTGTSVTSKTHRATSSCQRPMSMPNTAPPTAPADHIDPPVCMLLELMDIHDPSPTFSYVDKESDLADFGMKTVMQVYGMHQVLLATVGGLGKEGAGSLHAYVDKWLLPVIQPKGKGSTVGGRQEDVVAVEVEEVWGDRKGKGRILGRLLEEERHEAILVSSDEEGEQKRQEQAKDEDGPPIEVLKNEDDDDATTDTESFE